MGWFGYSTWKQEYKTVCDLNWEQFKQIVELQAELAAEKQKSAEAFSRGLEGGAMNIRDLCEQRDAFRGELRILRAVAKGGAWPDGDQLFGTASKEARLTEEAILKLHEELKAERAKVAAAEARPVNHYTLYQTLPSANGHYGIPDPEADRIAALPKCGSTKRCPKCGNTDLRRSLITCIPNSDFTGVRREYLRVVCVCNWDCQERTLDNPGVKGK